MKRICVVLFVLLSFSLTSFAGPQLKAVTGHRIRVDNNIGDWVGLAPVKENTSTVDKGEYIYRDAKKDDVGPGKYTYPKNQKLKKGADIREFRVTYDDKRIYFMIKTSRPNEWWAPYRLIAIDTDGHYGKTDGSVVLAQGDVDELDSYNGCYAELKVAPELACEYVIGVASTFKGRLWDKDGRLIAKADGNENDTPGFKVADANWYALEIAVPFSMVGDPRGKTWRFIVAAGLQDKDILREVFAKRTEWNGGGSKEKSELEDGADPDVYDLIGANIEDQMKDLSGYKLTDDNPEPKHFTTIRKSFVTVTFAPKK
ncbi:MAG: hypothetical protein KAI43_08320 [Candidatus Aureabacteria bacterium]|nr:hypothetical protein [Candidatus Auribacterota bacterium]